MFRLLRKFLSVHAATLVTAGAFVVLWAFGTYRVYGQPVNGTTGLLNIPSAEMQKDGTLFFGANYLPDEITPSSFDYNTGNYFFNITFLPFFEFNYRMTFLKMSKGDVNQDRTFGMRLRLFREKEFLPAFVIGGNDLYSTSGQKSTYFNSLYGVATKNFRLGERGNLGLTAGYAHEGIGNADEGNMKGPFGGAAFSPGFYPSLRLIGEYDTNAINAGASVLLWRHLFLYGMFYDLKIPTAGLAVFLYLK